MASETHIGGHLSTKGGIFELQKENCRLLPTGDHPKAHQDQSSDQLGPPKEVSQIKRKTSLLLSVSKEKGSH